jgi:hypothetical protein
MTETRVATVDRQTGELIERQSDALMVSPTYIKNTLQSLALLQDMVKNLLVPGRDYGRTPGTQGEGLWDPGASLLVGSFNCYFGHRRVLSLVDEPDKISVVVEVPVVSRQTGQEVGSGIGAASTMETKYKYRWLYESELKQLGYTDEDIKALPASKKEYQKGKRRIDNPERGELLNTLITQASKRAEVDAAKALPAVGSALRELFDEHERQRQGQRGDNARTKAPPAAETGESWTWFWAENMKRGIDPEDTHVRLKIASMKDWVKGGRTLKQALEEIDRQLAAENPPTEAPPFNTEETEVYEGTLASTQQEIGIDQEWLIESLKKIHWDKGTTLNSWFKSRYPTLDLTGDLKTILARLTREQKEQFVKEVNARLEMA